jgi:hypothetical protein
VIVVPGREKTAADEVEDLALVGSRFALAGETPVGIIAWWSLTLASSTNDLPSGRSPVPGASRPS